MISHAWPLKRQRLLRSKRPIFAGPFLGEVGLEVLYWLSFLDKLKADGVDPARLIPIARGGSAAWYGTPTGIELYAMRSLQDVRVENAVRHRETGMIKQMHVAPFDRQVVQDAARTLGLKHYHTLHPSWMYQTLAPFWNGDRGLDWLMRRAAYNLQPPPPLPAPLELPSEFVAVKFYFRATFQYKHPALELAKAVVKKLASQWPVIVLNTGVHADDHMDLHFKDLPNVTELRQMASLTPENTLWWQSAVIARAQGFVGTYGGLAQLAQRFAKPCVTFYTDWGGTLMSHKHLSDAIALRTGIPFIVQAVKDLPMLNSVIPSIMQAPLLQTGILVPH